MTNPCSSSQRNKRMVWTVNDGGDLRLWALDCRHREWEQEYLEEHLQFPSDSMILNKLPKKRKSSNSRQHKDAFINLLKSEAKKNCDRHSNRGVLLSHFNVNALRKEKQKKTRETENENKDEKQNGYPSPNRKRKRKIKRFSRTYGYNKGKLQCVKGHYAPLQFPWLAIAGNDRPVEVWDFNKQKCIFSGHHHQHWLGHQHEVSINDVDWARKSVNPYLCAAVTAQSELKLYDVRTGKSMLAQKIGDYALNKVRMSSKKKVLIGDSNGNLWSFDYRKPSKERGYVYRRYRGFVGSIKDFDLHPTRSLMASVGLGRYAVVHRLNQPHLPLFRAYLKQKLNAVLFAARYDTKYLPEDDGKEEHGDGGGDDVDGFLNDSESLDEDEEHEEEQEEHHEEVEEEQHESGDQGFDGFDGYDTDEMKELLHEMKDGDTHQPPKKMRKINV